MNFGSASRIKSARDDLKNLKEECLSLLSKLDEAIRGASADHVATVRLMAPGLLYSVWERFFKVGHSICVKQMMESIVSNRSLSPEQAAFFLIKSPDTTRFISKIGAGRTNIDVLASYLKSIFVWVDGELVGSSGSSDDFIITKSNVDSKVVELNSRLLKLTDFQSFKELPSGRLNDLVGLRNDIAHGAQIADPGERRIKELQEFTVSYIKLYNDVLDEWLGSQIPKSASKRKKKVRYPKKEKQGPKRNPIQ